MQRAVKMQRPITKPKSIHHHVFLSVQLHVLFALWARNHQFTANRHVTSLWCRRHSSPYFEVMTSGALTFPNYWLQRVFWAVSSWRYLHWSTAILGCYFCVSLADHPKPTDPGEGRGLMEVKRSPYAVHHTNDVINLFAVAGPSTWNSLPKRLRDPSHSTSVFGRLLKTFLFSE